LARIEPSLLGELADRAQTERWAVSSERFEAALVRSLTKAFSDAVPDATRTARYLRGLHLEDLALACACEAGSEDAWEHFINEFRPQLYRAAGAIDTSGAARELADALYGELFGVKEQDGVRQSLFRYFHGRSSLGTWLRAVLSQRHVDRLRASQRLTSLDEDAPDQTATVAPPQPDWALEVKVLLAVLGAAVARLAARDRLRLACYHAQNLTLAQIGRLTGEHEATVSRHLTRTRRDLRREVEHELATTHGMKPAEIAECFSAAVQDAGELDVTVLLGVAEPRKTPRSSRST
jgi:RNA polymerase sigma factor (sigma-70 family)